MNATRTAGAVVALLAVAVATALTLVQRDVDRCNAARKPSTQALRSNDRAQIDDAVEKLVDGCRGSETVAGAAAFYIEAKQSESALALASEATRREPDGYVGWAVLAVAARRSDPGLAKAARTRALALNPRAGRGP